MNSVTHNYPPDALRGGMAPWFSLCFRQFHESRATAQPFEFVESVNSGVSIMGRISLSELRGAGCSVEALDRLFRPESVKASVAAAVASEPHIELSTLQTIALLRMNRSTLCRGIATHLQNETQDTPSRFDYVPLVVHDLARKPAEDERWHTITPKGSRFATELAGAKAKELGIHILIPGGFTGAQQDFSCTCGKWNVCYRRGVHTDSNALRGWGRHVAKESPTAQAESA